MPINSYKQGSFSFLHASQIDALYTVLTSTQIKAALDSQSAELKANYNNLIDFLQGTTSDSGAKAIGVQTISGVTGNDVQTVLNFIYTLEQSDKAYILSQISGVVLGQIPDGSLTNAKQSTDTKIGSLLTLLTLDKSSIISALNEHLSDSVFLDTRGIRRLI